VKELNAVYKCRLCGETFRTFTVGESIANRILLSLELKDLSLQRGIAGGVTYEQCTHICHDNSLGIADFLGFKMEEKPKEFINEELEDDG
jgi:hypothetical protein